MACTEKNPCYKPVLRWKHSSVCDQAFLRATDHKPSPTTVPDISGSLLAGDAPQGRQTVTPMARQALGLADVVDVRREFSHYHKRCPFEMIDVYRVLMLFEVSDPALQHAIKKLLVAGGRGAKDAEKDVQEAIASLVRWQDMRKEERELP